MATPNNPYSVFTQYGNQNLTGNTGFYGPQTPNTGFMDISNFGHQMPIQNAQALAGMGGGNTQQSPSFMTRLLGGEEGGNKYNSMGQFGLGAASTLLNGYLGMQNLGLAKDQYKLNRETFDKNYAAQKSTTNAALEQRAINNAHLQGDGAPSVAEYMAKYGIQ